MSNVLIGIIGVILFIGLAIAGALFLGPRFGGVTNTSKATALASTIAQVTQAIDMYEMKTGRHFAVGTSLTTLQPRFLKSLGANPTGGGEPFTMTGSAAGDGGRVSYVARPLGTGSERVCAELAKQTGQGASYQVVAAPADLPSSPKGCFKATSTFGALTSGVHYAYSRTGAMETASLNGGGAFEQPGAGSMPTVVAGPIDDPIDGPIVVPPIILVDPNAPVYYVPKAGEQPYVMMKSTTYEVHLREMPANPTFYHSIKLFCGFMRQEVDPSHCGGFPPIIQYDVTKDPNVISYTITSEMFF